MLMTALASAELAVDQNIGELWTGKMVTLNTSAAFRSNLGSKWAIRNFNLKDDCVAKYIPPVLMSRDWLLGAGGQWPADCRHWLRR